MSELEQLCESYGVEAITALLRQKVQVFKNTAADAELDIRVAKVMEDKMMLENAAKRLKDILKGLTYLEQLLTTLLNDTPATN